MFSVFLGFIIGALTIIVVEVLAFFHVLNRLNRKKEAKPKESQAGHDLDPQQSHSFAYDKKGFVWILESERVLKIWSVEKVSREKKRKKEIYEVLPLKKFANIKDQSLILTDSDGSQATIQLAGCIILAVSASSLSSRKWAKRYPIKVESRNSIIYNGSRTCYMYLKTSWEKESWCKALRLAAYVDKERVDWYSKLNEEFHDYMTSLNAGYPSFMKTCTGFSCEPTDKTNKIDGSSSKVRLFLKKLARKASKSGLEDKARGTSLSGHEERKFSEKSRSVQDLFLTTGSKIALTEKNANSSLEEDRVPPLPSIFTHSGSQSQVSVISDADSDGKFGIDEGTLCWNLLISRLFFDAKSNADMKSSIRARIQRTLNNMRIPSYIGGVTCTGLDLGNLPPYIHSMRVLPMDKNEVWTMEIDIEYSGGSTIDVETRLDVHEPDFQKGIVDKSLEPTSIGEATSDLLEGFEYFGNQLKLCGGTVDKIEKRDDGDNKPDGMKYSKSSSWKSPNISRWKSILNSIANQVSQVPFSLAIRVTSIRGKVRLHIKPPPSDQLWFGFTSMPDIDFNLESSVGDHKITSGHIASLLGTRFKAAIRDTLVFPNCECVCIPWMLAEKDDWVPREVAPFIWVNQDAVSEPTVCKAASSHLGEGRTEFEASAVSKQSSSDNLEDQHEITENVVSVQKSTCEPPSELASSSQPEVAPSNSPNQSTRCQYLQDLRTPLLRNDEPEENCNQSRMDRPDYQLTTRSVIVTAEQAPLPKRVGRRERMMGLGKKMGEKLEEKRRHIEEKGKHIVDKMRGP